MVRAKALTNTFGHVPRPLGNFLILYGILFYIFTYAVTFYLRQVGLLNAFFVCVCLFLFFSFFFLWAAPMAHGVSQARGPIGAVAMGLCQSLSNARSELRQPPTPQLTATPDP